MNKTAIQEAFPPGIVGREIVLAQMCHHYRRINRAKARVDTNLYKPLRISLRPLSAEVESIVQRNLSPRSPPKHRRCLKYEHDLREQLVKPSTRAQSVESRLRATPEVYHPAVRSVKTSSQEFGGHQQATQTSVENSLLEEFPPKTKDEAVQTSIRKLYRPLDVRSVQFLKDVTTDALHQRAFTSLALNRLFLDHQCRNEYSISQELMERELEVLRRQLGMLPRCQSNCSTVSDADALAALDTLCLDPRMKQQIIISLRLSRNDNKKKPTYSYFERLKDNEEEGDPKVCSTTTASMPKEVGDPASGPPSFDEETLNTVRETITEISLSEEKTSAEGWDAEIHDDEEAVVSVSSAKIGEVPGGSESEEEQSIEEQGSKENSDDGNVHKGSEDEIEEDADGGSSGRMDKDVASSGEKDEQVDEIESSEDSEVESDYIHTDCSSSEEVQTESSNDDELSNRTVVLDKTDADNDTKSLSSSLS